MKRLSDEESKREEDKSYKIWEKEGGDLGVIRRRLVARKAEQNMVEWLDGQCPHHNRKRRMCRYCWLELEAEVKG